MARKNMLEKYMCHGKAAADFEDACGFIKTCHLWKDAAAILTSVMMKSSVDFCNSWLHSVP